MLSTSSIFISISDPLLPPTPSPPSLPPSPQPLPPSPSAPIEILEFEGDQEVSYFPPIKEVHQGIIWTNYHYPGDQKKQFLITLDNLKSSPVEYTLYYVEPVLEKHGYVKVSEARGWVIIDPTTVWVGSDEIKTARVTLAIPRDIVDVPDKWEFQIGIRDSTQTDMIQMAKAVRFMVDMR